jgi:hypothetical protein
VEVDRLTAVGGCVLGFIIVNLSDMITDINVSKTAIESMATFAVTVAFISGQCNLTCHGLHAARESEQNIVMK